MEPKTGMHSGWSQLVAIMLLRLGLISVFVGALAFVLPGDSIAFYAFMAFSYIATIPYSLWLRERHRPEVFVPVQFATDMIWVTGLVYFTGGPDSELVMLYPLVILSAGIITRPLRALQITLFCALCYLLLVILMAQGILRPYEVDGVASLPERAGLGNRVALRLLVFACFGLAAAYVARVCRYADRRVDRMRRIASDILRNVRVGLLLLDDDRIVEVNDRAGHMLQLARDDLLGRSIDEIIEEQRPEDTVDGRKQQVVCRFRRSDGSTFPAGIEVSRLLVAAEALPALEGEGEVEVRIMVFSDVSQLLRMQEQVREADRLQAVAATASNIAHEIRNPLAAISGSVQLLQRMEKRAEEGDVLYRMAMGERRDGVYRQLITASSELDRAIERFISYAAASPEALIRLMRYNDENET